MARQPNIIQPFEPFASGRQLSKRTKNIITDDRRAWFASIPGINFSNEVVVTGTGTSLILTEALNLRLPRPEPVTISFHPWANSGDRFRLMAHLMAEIEPITNPALQVKNGRIYVEWGTGQSRGWTYFDAGPGSLQLPSVSEVRVYGWSYTTEYVLSVNAQVGYASSDLSATWTFQIRNNIAYNNSKFLPNFARNITGYGGWLAYDLNDLSDIQIRDANNYPMMNWSVRPPIAPNPSQIPYPCSNVPLSGAARLVRLAIVNNVGEITVTTAVNVKI
jgi:hypothetical protein